MSDTREVWTKDGHELTLHAVNMAEREAAFIAECEELYGDDFYYEPWYPESSDQRPPQTYELRMADGTVWYDLTVFPLEPWSPYDAVSDRLIREGYEPPAPTEEELELCEHGLSARLCAGPMHYPDDDRFDW